MGMIQLPTFRMNGDEQIVPMRYEHLISLQLKKHEIEYQANIPNYIDYIYENSEDGLSWSAIGRGRIIAVFGVRPIWRGLAEAWMVPGVGIEDHAASVVRGARALMDTTVSNLDIARLQIIVKTENDTAYKFAKSIGFSVEGKLERFGPEGADYYMMVRFK